MTASHACGHVSMGNPWAPYCYPYWAWPGPYAYAYPVLQWPVCCEQQHHGHCAPPPMVLPEEMLVDDASPKKEVFVGGIRDAKLTLEYMPAAGATGSPAVTVTIIAPGSTSTWKEEPIPDGYHVKKDFPTVATGAKIQVEVADAVARLRWCEVIEC